MGFSLDRSAESVRLDDHMLFQNVGLAQLTAALWSSRAARPPIVMLSARPRKLRREYSKEPRGPQNVCWLVLKVLGSPTGGRLGSAMVPPGTFPPLFITSKPKPYAIWLRLDSCTLISTSLSGSVVMGRSGSTLAQSKTCRS